MWDGVSVVAPVPRDGSLTDTPGISSRDGTNSTWSHGDIKNSLRQTGESETTSATKQYDAFGNHVASSGSWSGPFQYGGHFGYQTNPDSNLKLLGHRYYEASTGRFLTRDPIGEGENWYSYCQSNPVVFIDPEGLSPRVIKRRFPSRKAAYEAALSKSAKGFAPIEHPNPVVGNPHFHAVDHKGQKRRNPNVHYEYPRRHSTPPKRLAPLPVPVNPSPDPVEKQEPKRSSRAPGIDWRRVGAWVLVGALVTAAVVVSVASAATLTPVATAVATTTSGIVILSTETVDPGT